MSHRPTGAGATTIAAMHRLHRLGRSTPWLLATAALALLALAGHAAFLSWCAPRRRAMPRST